MDAMPMFMLSVFFLILVIGIPVALARWVFRVNERAELLKRIADGIEYIIDADKKEG